MLGQHVIIEKPKVTAGEHLGIKTIVAQSLKIGCGLQSTTTLQAPQIQVQQDLSFTGGHATIGGRVVYESLGIDRFQRDGDTFRFYSGYTRVPHGIFANLSVGRLFLGMTTGEMHGVNITAQLLWDQTRELFVGPLEGDAISSTTESRKSSGLFGSKSAQTSVLINQHLITPPTVQVNQLILGNGTGGSIELQSLNLQSQSTLVQKDLIESAARERLYVETHTTSKNGPTLGLPKPPSLSFMETTPLGRTSEVMEKLSLGLNGATQFLQVSQNQLPLETLVMQQMGTIEWSQTRTHSILDHQRDYPLNASFGDTSFVGNPSMHLKGFNHFKSLQGTLSSLTSEPLQQVKIYDVRSHHQTQSFNPFTLNIGYGIQHQYLEQYEETYVPTTAVLDGLGEITVKDKVDLIGTEVSGSGSLSIQALCDVVISSKSDVVKEKKSEKHVSVSLSVPSLLSGTPLSLPGSGFGDSQSTHVKVGVEQTSKITLEGPVQISTPGTLTQKGSVIKGKVTAKTHIVEDVPTVIIDTSSFNVFGSLLRLASSGFQLSQSMQEFVQTLQPSTPSENFKSDLYMALEGVDPTQSIEILSDPEVQQVVEDVQQYTSKKQTQQLKKQEKTKSPEKLEKSVPSLTETLTSLDPSQVVKISVKTPLDTSNPVTSKVLSPDVKPSDLEGITLLNRVTTMQKKLFKKYPHLVEQIKQIGKVLEDHMDMAIDVGLNIASAYNLRGNLMKGAKFVRALQRGEKPYKAPPEQLEVQEGKPNFFGSYSEAPEFGGGTFKGFLKDEMGGGKSPFEPWMSKKQNLSVKQQKQIEGLEFYGQNPGDIVEGVHKGKPLLKVDTELPGGLQGAREFFKKLTGEHPPVDNPRHRVKIGEYSYQFREQGDSGHPKVEIEGPGKGSGLIIREKISFK